MTVPRFNEPDKTDFRLWIIWKLMWGRYFGKKHMDEDDLPKGNDPKYRKEIMKTLDQLVKEGYVVRFPHLSKRKIYLNMNRIKEFIDLLERIP